MDEKRVADYFVVAGLPPDNPLPLEEFSNEAVLKPTHRQDPIVDIAIINKSLGEVPPPKYKCLETTPSGFPADLNHGSIRAPEVYLCYKRGRDKPPLTDIGVLYEGKERVMAGCEVVYMTPQGRPANVNNNNSSRTYVTYRRAEDTAASDTLAVTDLCIILMNKSELPPHAFCQINKNLNKAMVGSDVFLCYKKSMAKANCLAYHPAALGRFPAHDYSAFPLPETVPMFCLPLGATIECWAPRAQHPQPVFSTFVLTGGAGEQVYGAAIMFYEEFDKSELSDSQALQLGLRSGLLDLEDASEKTVHRNKCMCLLSRWPFFDTYRKFLSYLYRISTSGPHSVPIERHISHFMNEVPFPSPQRPRILVQLTAEEAICLSQPEETPLPKSGASFITLLKNLGPENSISLMLYALMEMKILIHSLRPAVLTSVAECVANMIFPYHWQCPFIPLCPLGLSDVLSAPTPFIVGVDSRYFDLYDPPHDVTCVDLDTNTTTVSEDKRQMTNKMLPKKPLKVLRATLERLFEKLCADPSRPGTPTEMGYESAPIDQDFTRRRKELVMESAIQEAFLRFMACLLKGYNHFLLPITAKPTQGTTNLSSLFEIHGFLKSRDRAYHKFFNAMMRTQAFSRFIEERSFVSDKDASLAFFDECLDKVDESRDEPKLIELDEASTSERTVFIMPPEPTGLPAGATYSYNGFPELNNELFLHKAKPPPSMVNHLKAAGQACPHSPMTRRTKQEVKSAQKTSLQHSNTPMLWAKCLLWHCYSVWFIHLPAYVKSTHSKTKALRTAYDVLVKMQSAKLQPPDEVCYRVLMQLCGLYHQPVLAVKVLFEMKRNGVQPNAITYGFYNKAVLESKWPSSNTNAYLRWNKVRNAIIATAQFRKGLRGRRLSMYSNSVESDFDRISRTSMDSFLDEPPGAHHHEHIARHGGAGAVVVAAGGGGSGGGVGGGGVGGGGEFVQDLVNVETLNIEERSSTGGMSDRGYSSMTLDDAKRISVVIGSQDSLDSDTVVKRPMVRIKEGGERHAKLVPQGAPRDRKPNSQDAGFSNQQRLQPVDPLVDENFRKKIHSIVKTTVTNLGGDTKLHRNACSSAGLLITSHMGAEEGQAEAGGEGLARSLNLKKAQAAESEAARKRHKSAGDPHRLSAVAGGATVPSPPSLDGEQGVQPPAEGGVDTAGGGELDVAVAAACVPDPGVLTLAGDCGGESSTDVDRCVDDVDSLVIIEDSSSGKLTDSSVKTEEALVAVVSGPEAGDESAAEGMRTGGVVSPRADVTGSLLGGGVSVDSLFSEGGAHSPNRPGASPVHSLRTPVTENDPLGLFNGGLVLSDSQSSTAGESVANASTDANTSGYNSDTASRANRTNMLIDIEPFSGTSTPIRARQNPFDDRADGGGDKKRSPSLGDRSFTSSDSSSPASPVKPWSPLNQSLSETDAAGVGEEDDAGAGAAKPKSATLPANATPRDAMVTPPRRGNPVTRSSSFGNALRSAATRFATKFTELKNMSTPQKAGEAGGGGPGAPGHSRAGGVGGAGGPESHTQKLLCEEEENMFLRKAGSADELGGGGDEVDTAALEEAMGLRSKQRHMSRYTPFVSGFMSGLKSLQQPETWQGLATRSTKYMEYMKDAVNTSWKDSFSESFGITEHDDDEYYGSGSSDPDSPGYLPGSGGDPLDADCRYRAQLRRSQSENGQGSAPPHSLLDHYIPTDDADRASLDRNSLRQNSGSIQSIPQTFFNTAMEVEICSLSRCQSCSSLLYDEEIMAGWSADDSNLNTTCQFCSAKLVPLLQIHIKDYRQGNKPVMMTPSQSVESMLSVQSGSHPGGVVMRGAPNGVSLPPGGAEQRTSVTSEQRASVTSAATVIDRGSTASTIAGDECAMCNGDARSQGDRRSVSSLVGALETVDEDGHVTEAEESSVFSEESTINETAEEKLIDLSPVAAAAPSLPAGEVEVSTDVDVPPRTNVDTEKAEQQEDGEGKESNGDDAPPPPAADVDGQEPAGGEKDNVSSGGKTDDSNSVASGGADDKKDKKRGILSEPLTYPYLSPLVLRKEIENVLDHDGDLCLTKPEFVDEHPIIYWNMVWYFKRLDVASHMPGFILTARSTNRDNPPPKSWQAADSRHIKIQAVWDNLRMHEEVGQPMYCIWNQASHQSSTVNALVTEANIFTKSLAQHIVSSIMCNDVTGPIRTIMKERRKAKQLSGRARFRSIYRDILFLSLVALGRDNIDHDALDREYRQAYNCLSPRDHQRLKKNDQPPKLTVCWCRRMFGELDL